MRGLAIGIVIVGLILLTVGIVGRCDITTMLGLGALFAGIYLHGRKTKVENDPSKLSLALAE